MNDNTTDMFDPHREATGDLPADVPAGDGLRNGSIFAGYTILATVGAGGMGMVYLAQQSAPKRRVALKLIKPGALSSQALRRFELEAEILGRLQHPCIARVYDAGVHDERGVPAPYFAMEYIEGRPPVDYAESVNLDVSGRLALFARICDAVQHAHTKGVVHRDLKPANILVDVSEPSEPTPKVLDFGVARFTDGDTQTITQRTEIGQLVGTIPYMSPEQAAGDPSLIDTRSDVYGLGVVLYELLTGRLPHDLREKMLLEAVRVIKEDDHTRLSSVKPALRGDIETIVGKALEKDRERRYQSASDLASDVRRFLSDEPIAARPASTWYQLQKFSKRNKPLVAGVAAAFAALLVGLAGTSFGFLEANRQAGIAAERADDAEAALLERDAALEAEQQRSQELESVAKFQAEQLRGINPELLGSGLRMGLLAEIPEDRREDAVRAIAGVNFTNLALDSLRQNIFEQTIGAINEQFSAQPIVKAGLLQSTADVLLNLGLVSSAEGPQAEALSLRRTALGDEDADTLSSINAAGNLHLAQGDFDRAEPLYQEAPRISRSVLGAEHRFTIVSAINLGRLRNDQGRNADAERHFREALTISRRVLGHDDPDTLLVINNLGGLLYSQGRFAEAQPLLLEALETRKRTLGDEHPDTLQSINNLGLLLMAQGKLSEADPYMRETLEVSRRVHGDEHPEMVQSLRNLGVLLFFQGRLTEAEPYLRESLAISRRVLGSEHLQTLTTVGNLGFLLSSMGRLSEAEPFYRESLSVSRQVLGDEHPQTLSSINNMGRLFHDQQRLSDAERLYTEALSSRRRVLGNEHQHTLLSVTNMGLLRQDQGRLLEAEELLREALEAGRRSLGVEHPDTVKSVRNLAEVLTKLASFAEAEVLALECEHLSQKIYGPVHSETLEAHRLLASLYAEWHRSDPTGGYDTMSAEWESAANQSDPAGSAPDTK